MWALALALSDRLRGAGRTRDAAINHGRRYVHIAYVHTSPAQVAVHVDDSPTLHTCQSACAAVTKE